MARGVKRSPGMNKFSRGMIWVAVASTLAGARAGGGTLHRVPPGQVMTGVEVKRAGPLRVEFSVRRPREALDRLPTARVVRQDAGFSCRVRGVEWLSRSPPGGRWRLDRYQLRVEWQPGADLSGCLIRVEDPGGGSRLDMEVFMSL